MMFLTFAKEQRLLLGAGIGLGLLGAITTLLQPLAVGNLITAVVDGRSVGGPILFIVCLFLLDAALGALNGYLIGRAGENLVFSMRRQIFRRLIGSDLRAFNRFDHGDMQTRTVGDTSIASVVIAQALAQIVTSSFLVLGCLGVMTLMDWRLTAATVGCLGLASVVAILLAARVRVASVTNREHTSEIGSRLHRVLGGLTTVKASRAEARELTSLTEQAGQARRSGIKVSALSACLMPAMNVGTQISLAVVIAWGMVRLASGDLTAGELTAFVMYLFYLVSPLVLVFMSFAELQQGMASVDRVTELLNIDQEREGEGRDAQDALAPASPEQNPTGADRRPSAPVPVVRFKGVSFAYRDDEPVLSDVSLEVPSVGMTAIVGPSGAGKSSILHLVDGFYPAGDGLVEVQGRDVRTIDLDQLRSTVGYVEQDAPLLKGTFRENLVYARPDASDRDIEEVLRMANLDDVVRGLPQGIDTPLGERGAGLSGGQRQRLAIARTLLQRPDVLLLDEATAHLDGDSESALRQTLTKVARERAVVIVAHRMSTVREAQQIVVVESGRVRDRGTHEQLMTTNDMYARLVRQQESGSGSDDLVRELESTHSL